MQPATPYFFRATDGRIGAPPGAKGDDRIRISEADEGCVLYGPYVTLPKGRYRAIVTLTDQTRLRGKLTMDVCARLGEAILEKSVFDLSRARRTEPTIQCDFTLDEETRECEVRLHCQRGMSVEISSVEIEPLDRVPTGGDMNGQALASPTSPRELLSSLGDSLFPTEYIGLLDRETVLNEFRKRCQVSYLGNRTALCRVMGRFHMFVETTDVGFAVHAMHGGFWEHELAQFLAGKMRPGMRVIDVGANYGYFSLLMAQLVGAQGHCFSFEPNPKIYKLLVDTLAVNGFASRSDAFEIALGSGEHDKVGFLIPDFEPKNAHVIHHRPDGELNATKYVEVASTSLDALADRLGRIDFIKIDAEGAEIDIVKGMASLLAQQRPDVLVEFNFRRAPHARPSIESLVALYGGMQVVGLDGQARSIDVETIMATDRGEDWLLYFSRPQ